MLRSPPAADLGYPIVVKPIALAGAPSPTARSARTPSATPADPATSVAGWRSSGRRRCCSSAGCPATALGVELLMDRGRPLAAFQHRRLREVATHRRRQLAPRERRPRSGPATTMRSRCSASSTGPAWRWSSSGAGRTAIGHLMEINGRVWGSLPLAVRAGMDFPGRLADLLLDGPPADRRRRSRPTTARGVTARNLRLDLAWIGAVLSGRRRQRPTCPGPGAAPRRARSPACSTRGSATTC